MGATYVAETATGGSPAEALRAMLDKLTSGGDPDWTEPYAKAYVRGWTQQNPPDGVDPGDKWGPWLMFPLASGGWHFYGWVNT